MKGTPQTKRKPPVRAETSPRIISRVQKPRNTATNTAQPPSEQRTYMYSIFSLRRRKLMSQKLLCVKLKIK